MKPGHLQKYVLGRPMEPLAPTAPKTELEVQLELARYRLEDMAARLAACTSEWHRGRLANELGYQRRTVERLEAELSTARALEGPRP